MKRAKSTSENSEALCAVKTWVKEDKQGADLCTTMLTRMGKDL